MKHFKDAIFGDWSLHEFTEGVEALEELNNAKARGLTLCELIKEDDPNLNRVQYWLWCIAARLMLQITKYKLKQFKRKHPEELL